MTTNSWSDSGSSILTQAAATGVKVLDYLRGGFPSLNVVSNVAQKVVAQTGNKSAKAIMNNSVSLGWVNTGILDNLLNPMNLANSNGADSTPSSAGSSSNDASAAIGGNTSGIPNLPFWVKTAIVGAVLIGTTLIIKGSFND